MANAAMTSSSSSESEAQRGETADLVERARERLLELDPDSPDFEVERIAVDRLLRRASLVLVGIAEN